MKKEKKPNYGDLIVSPIEWIVLGMMIMVLIMGLGR